MAVSTADSSCLRMLIRFMMGFLQIIPMKILRISGRRGCTQLLLLTCLKQTSKVCLATIHVSLDTWTACLYFIFYCTWTSLLSFLFCLFILFQYFFPFIAYLDRSISSTWTSGDDTFFMLLLAVVECFPVHQFILNCALGCAWTSFSF